MLPTSPVFPKTSLNLALGLLVGLVLGVGAAVARDALDPRLRTSEQAAVLSELPLFGVVPIDPAGTRLPTRTAASSPQGEAYRIVRANLESAARGDAAGVVLVTSSVPGEGKTTTACNLAVALAQAGAKVVLVDADLRRPMVHEFLSVGAERGLAEVLAGESRAATVIQSGELVHVLAAGAVPSNPSEALDTEQMVAARRAAQQLRRRGRRQPAPVAGRRQPAASRVGHRGGAGRSHRDRQTR